VHRRTASGLPGAPRAASIHGIMTRGWRRLGLMAAFVAAVAPGCSKLLDSRPKKETVLPALQQEAQSLKVDGEKVDPKLLVKTTWNILSIDVQEQSGNEDNPWTGTIRMKIDSTMKDVDGSPLNQSFEKRFDYVYSAALKRWIIQYTPPAR
jgi:hypothetical protein